jgi:hypothetical protein
MARNSVSATAYARIWLVLAIAALIVSSLTRHHGAMARDFSFETPGIIASSHHAADARSADRCTSDRHSIPVCCGMGLCLSGIPPKTDDVLSKLSNADALAHLPCPEPFRMFDRIDRPPKDFPKAGTNPQT